MSLTSETREQRTPSAVIPPHMQGPSALVLCTCPGTLLEAGPVAFCPVSRLSGLLYEVTCMCHVVPVTSPGLTPFSAAVFIDLLDCYPVRVAEETRLQAKDTYLHTLPSSRYAEAPLVHVVVRTSSDRAGQAFSFASRFAAEHHHWHDLMRHQPPV